MVIYTDSYETERDGEGCLRLLERERLELHNHYDTF